jgi:hypothetical protein
MTGYLRGCKLQNSAPPPAAAPVEDWHSRPTNPPYLSAMPYEEQVRSTIKGTSPDDTQARQLTVFIWIPQMIAHMREASRPYGSPWTPDETRITYAYNLAAKQIREAYAQSHTPQQTKELSHLEGHYEMMDDQFYKQWTTALFPADFLNDYNHAFWGMLEQYKAHVDQERKQNEEAAAHAKAAQEAAAQGTRTTRPQSGRGNTGKPGRQSHPDRGFSTSRGNWAARGKLVGLMRDSFDKAFRDVGVRLDPGTTPAQAWKAYTDACRLPGKCDGLEEEVAHDFAAVGKVDPSGRCTFPSVPEGNYFLTANTLLNKQTFFWDVSVTLKPGANSVTLDEHNGEVVP